MKRVKMLTNIVGVPSPTHHTGDIVELEDKVADAWIEDGLAMLHRDEAKTAETAARRT